MATELVAVGDDLLAYADRYEHECPACGDPSGYCQGHGEIGDPVGFEILKRHDNSDHTECWETGHCD